MIIGIHRSHGYFSSCLAHSHRFSQASKTEVYVANKHDRLRCRRTQEARKLKITCKADTKEKSVIKIFVCPFQEQTAPAKHNLKKNTLVTTQVTSWPDILQYWPLTTRWATREVQRHANIRHSRLTLRNACKKFQDGFRKKTSTVQHLEKYSIKCLFSTYSLNPIISHVFPAF